MCKVQARCRGCASTHGHSSSLPLPTQMVTQAGKISSTMNARRCPAQGSSPSNSPAVSWTDRPTSESACQCICTEGVQPKQWSPARLYRTTHETTQRTSKKDLRQRHQTHLHDIVKAFTNVRKEMVAAIFQGLRRHLNSHPGQCFRATGSGPCRPGPLGVRLLPRRSQFHKQRYVQPMIWLDHPNHPAVPTWRRQVLAGDVKAGEQIPGVF